MAPWILTLRVSSSSSHCYFVSLMVWTAVAAHLALYKFTLKTSPPSAFSPELTESLPVPIQFNPSSESGDWDTGVVYAKAQNLARTVSQ